MNDKTKVTTGKPSVAGAIWRAPIGTELPADASTPLAAAFKPLGYISEDGLKEGSENKTQIIAWGGDIVLNVKGRSFTFTLIEAKNEEVLKLVYGDGNIADTDGALTILDPENSTPESGVLVVELMLSGGQKQRKILPNAVVSEVGEVSYTDSDAVGYETTVGAVADSNGMLKYEYITAPAA